MQALEISIACFWMLLVACHYSDGMHVHALTFISMCMQFHFENMKRKAQQRIKEGRPQPVDPLAANLFLMPEFDPSISAPHAIFIGLTLSEVEDVREEIMTWQVCVRTSCYSLRIRIMQKDL